MFEYRCDNSIITYILCLHANIHLLYIYLAAYGIYKITIITTYTTIAQISSTGQTTRQNNLYTLVCNEMQ